MKLLKKSDGQWFIRITKDGTYQDLVSWINQHAFIIGLVIWLLLLLLKYVIFDSI